MYSLCLTSYSGFKGNIRTEELMNLKSSSSSNILLAAALSWALLSCEESGMVTPPCCHTFLVSDVFCGLGLSDFWGSSDDEKILRPINSSSYKPLDSENKCNEEHLKIKNVLQNFNNMGLIIYYCRVFNWECVNMSAVVKVLASHQYGPGGVIGGFSFSLLLILASKVFLWVLQFYSLC